MSFSLSSIITFNEFSLLPKQLIKQFPVFLLHLHVKDFLPELFYITCGYTAAHNFTPIILSYNSLWSMNFCSSRTLPTKVPSDRGYTTQSLRHHKNYSCVSSTILFVKMQLYSQGCSILQISLTQHVLDSFLTRIKLNVFIFK